MPVETFLSLTTEESKMRCRNNNVNVEQKNIMMILSEHVMVGLCINLGDLHIETMIVTS